MNKQAEAEKAADTIVEAIDDYLSLFLRERQATEDLTEFKKTGSGQPGSSFHEGWMKRQNELIEARAKLHVEMPEKRKEIRNKIAVALQSVLAD